LQRRAAKSRLIVLSVDGLHPSLYRCARELGVKVPNIEELARRGASAESTETIYPSSTYPAHTTLVTGVAPRVHGIYSHLASLDPTERARPWHWFAAAINVPTLWNLGRAHGLTTAAISWPVSAGAPIDFNIPEIWDPAVPDPHQDFLTVARHSTPRLFEEVAAALKPGAHPDPDHLRGEAGLYLWRKHNPDLMLIHFVGYDAQAHRHGPRSHQALHALEHTDQEIGRICDAVAGEKHTTLVVVSDHGFLPVHREVAPLTILKEEGLFDTRGKKHPELKRLGAVHAGGSFAVFWLEEPEAADRHALDRALHRLMETGAIAEVVDRAKLEQLGSDPDAEWILDAADGFCFSSRFDGPAVGEESQDRGTHGQLPTRAGMEASFIVTGPEVAPGRNLGRVRLAEIAPTLAHLLGLDLRELAGAEEPLILGN
jgi:predicted AlkP superfamily pyrophosphatase or phosphodiesterase